MIRFWELPLVLALFGTSGLVVWVVADLAIAAVVLVVGFLLDFC